MRAEPPTPPRALALSACVRRSFDNNPLLLLSCFVVAQRGVIAMHQNVAQSRETPPKISVVTPSYNQGRFLETCICSVIDQDYPRLEHIVIDGGSTDNSLEIIQKHQAHLTYWVSEPDAGQSDALNKGLSRARGDVVAWLNSDDFYLPGALAQVAQAYQAAPTAPFYFGDGLRVDESGKPQGAYFPKGLLRFNRAALCFGLDYILQPATFIRRQCLKQVGYLSRELQYGLDFDLWLRLLDLGEPVPIQAQLAATREYGATKTATGSFGRLEELRQIVARHTGAPITPGVLCYYLDTLHRLAQERNDLFPPAYQRDILRFWEATSAILERFGARPDGFPLAPGEEASLFHRLKRAGLARLRTVVKGHPFLANRHGRQ